MQDWEAHMIYLFGRKRLSGLFHLVGIITCPCVAAKAIADWRVAADHDLCDLEAQSKPANQSHDVISHLNVGRVYLWKCACAKELPGCMFSTSSVFTGLLKGRSELTARKLLKSWVPSSRSAASRMAPTSNSLVRDINKGCGIINNSGFPVASREAVYVRIRRTIYRKLVRFSKPCHVTEHVRSSVIWGRWRKWLKSWSCRQSDASVAA